MFTLVYAMVVFALLALTVLVVCRTVQGADVRHVYCPRCKGTNHVPDHTVGCNKCRTCGVWFPVPYEEQ